MDRIRNDHSRARVCALVVAVIAVLGLSTGLRADDGVDAVASEAGATGESSTANVEESSSDRLRANLEETISEGSKALRQLPKSRRRITKTRVANLERQVKRKEREREQLQESLAVLRSDFYRRLAAIRKNDGRIPARDLDKREKRLRDDYDMHAESFEEEVKALDTDLVEIRRKIHQLKTQYETAERLKPAKRISPEDDDSVYSETVMGIPDRIDPFVLRSYVDDVRGRDTAPRPVLWALKGEIAFQQGDLDTAEQFWIAALERNTMSGYFDITLETNLAHVAYESGDFVRCYEIFADSFRGRIGEELSEEEAYTMAVLSYLNGLMDDTRTYMAAAGEEDRVRFESVIGRIGEDPGV